MQTFKKKSNLQIVTVKEETSLQIVTVKEETSLHKDKHTLKIKGQTSLHRVGMDSYHNYIYQLNQLIRKEKLEDKINDVDETGSTALHYFCKNYRIKGTFNNSLNNGYAIRDIFLHKPDLTITDNAGKTAFEYLCEHVTDDVVLVLEFLRRIPGEFISNKPVQTALETFCSRDKGVYAEKLLLECFECIDAGAISENKFLPLISFLLRLKVSANIKDDFNNKLLHMVCTPAAYRTLNQQPFSIQTIRALLEHGADPVIDIDGKTALDLARQWVKPEPLIVEALSPVEKKSKYSSEARAAVTTFFTSVKEKQKENPSDNTTSMSMNK